MIYASMFKIFGQDLRIFLNKSNGWKEDFANYLVFLMYDTADSDVSPHNDVWLDHSHFKWKDDFQIVHHEWLSWNLNAE